MTITHISHFGLELVARTEDNVIFSGSLGDCRRMAFAHGMEIDRYEGQIIAINNGKALYAPVNEKSYTTIWFKGSGLITKGRDDWSLVMPVKLWESAI